MLFKRIRLLILQENLLRPRAVIKLLEKLKKLFASFCTALKRGRSSKERRSDEAALYHIIDRDLERGALFPRCNYWASQERIRGRWRIDYALRYGRYLLGIEVKQDVPKASDFGQVVKKYLPSLNAAYLAYPADYAAQAIYVKPDSPSKTVGLISIAKFRSHVFRPAMVITRKDNRLWDEVYDDRKWIIEPGPEPYKWELQLAKGVLLERALPAYFNEQLSDSRKNVAMISLGEREWGTLASLFVASQVYSYLQPVTWDEMSRIQNRLLRLGNPLPEKPLSARLVRKVMHGRYRLNSYCLDMPALYLLKDLKAALREKLGASVWARVERTISEEKKSLATFQGERSSEFLRATSRVQKP